VRLRVLGLVAAIGTLAWSSPGAGADDYALIRNAHNPIEALTPTQVKDMAVGKKKTWPHGAVVVLVLTRPGTPELHWFASLVGRTEKALMETIKVQVFRGEMRKPITADTEEAILAAVQAEAGAIAVVRGELARKLPAGVAPLAVR
jgi:hypothetical protein